MKKIQIMTLVLACGALLTGCKDYLTAPEPGVTRLEDFYISGTAAVQNVTGCYVPLMWEFNETYFSEWYIGDIVSDDALKGGQNVNDGADAYDMENWKTTASNVILKDFYRAQYQGIGRCNLALKYIPNMATDSVLTDRMRARLLGEAHFLRAYYYFRLLRVFGGVPLTLTELDNSAEWQMPRASVEGVFDQVLADLTEAQKGL